MTVIRSEPSPPAAEIRPRLLPRVEAARVIVSAEAAMFALIALMYAFQQPFPYAAFVASVLAGALLGAGVWRIGKDTTPHAIAVPPEAERVWTAPWEWTDFVIFWPGAFVVGQLLISIAVLVAHPFTLGLDSTARTAVESFVAQAAYYAGALFNLWVLVGLRRGGTLSDLGWRRFRWWWIVVAVVGAGVTLEAAGFLQVLMQQLFPSLPNSQCTAVRHDYGHFLVLAVIVVCVVAPIAEETVFRGFVYGWMRRVSPAVVAIPASAAIFSAIHGVALLALPLFVVGCVLALFYQGSRSIVPGVLVHALFNLPGIISILYATSC